MEQEIASPPQSKNAVIFFLILQKNVIRAKNVTTFSPTFQLCGFTGIAHLHTMCTRAGNMHALLTQTPYKEIFK
jgi:hypothetical protein